MNISVLIEKAFEAREKSYSPYSDFMVGAALLTDEGDIYKGCNIECAVFTPTSCGERTAFVKAISEGKNKFSAIAIVGGKKGTVDFDYCYPCGVCRQFMAEFCDENFKVIVAKTKDDYIVYKLKELLPFSFTADNIK